MPKLRFQPEGKSVTVNKGESILRAAARARVFIPQKCGGRASCTTCKVHLLTPEAFTRPNVRELKLLTKEQIEQHIRLACQTLVLHDGAIERLPSPLTQFISNRKLEDDVD